MIIPSENCDQSVQMQKWGIPEDVDVSAETILLERLVWVKYKKHHWWPALLYADYTELQDHLYGHMDVVMKAQFSAAIMRQLNNPKPIKIARLLGRERLDVVEVNDKQYAEFYWQLPKVLPMACKKSNYGKDIKLYIDFHRALDQVEEIIRDISENSFTLGGGEAEKKTWVERANEALAAPGLRSSITGSATGSERIKQKEADDEEGYNFLFKALDNVFEQCNSTYDCFSGDQTIVETPSTTTFSAIRQQKATRDSLRKALARQRHIRESGGVPYNKNFVVTQSPSTDVLPGARYENENSVVKSQSTDVLPGVPSADDEDAQLRNLIDHEEAEENFERNDISMRDPEVTAFMPSKNKITHAQKIQFYPLESQEPVDSREDYQVDDRAARYKAARAAASAELDDSFWNYLTCNSVHEI